MFPFFKPVTDLVAKQTMEKWKIEKKTMEKWKTSIESGDMAEILVLLEEAPWLLNAKDKNGETALFWAARFASHTIVDFLIAKGADTLIENNDKKTAAEVAVQLSFGNVSAVFLGMADPEVATITMPF